MFNSRLNDNDVFSEKLDNKNDTPLTDLWLARQKMLNFLSETSSKTFYES